MIIAGNKIYETCGYCGKLVCLNKGIWGSIHVCALGSYECRYRESNNQIDINDKMIPTIKKDSRKKYDVERTS